MKNLCPRFVVVRTICGDWEPPLLQAAASSYGGEGQRRQRWRHGEKESDRRRSRRENCPACYDNNEERGGELRRRERNGKARGGWEGTWCNCADGRGGARRQHQGGAHVRLNGDRKCGRQLAAAGRLLTSRVPDGVSESGRKILLSFSRYIFSFLKETVDLCGGSGSDGDRREPRHDA